MYNQRSTETVQKITGYNLILVTISVKKKITIPSTKFIGQ